jgi:putative membrane protein (TIGR04086 family)
MRQLQWKAVLAGIGVYIGLWIAWNMVTPSIFEISTNVAPRGFRVSFEIFSILAAVVPGYVAAQVATERRVIHGLSTGVALALVMLLFWSVFGAISHSNLWGTLFYPVTLCVLGGLGGKLSELRARH